MIASELVLEQETLSLAETLPLLGDLIAPLFETGRVNSRISASDTSFSERATEFLRSSQSNNHEQTSNSFSGETSNTVFTNTNTGQQITTAKAPIDYSLAATNTTPLDSATQIDPLTGNSAEQAIVGKVATNYTYRDLNDPVTVLNNKRIRLQYIQTNANNIVLKSNNTSVPQSGSFGINGGFFVGGTRNILSIAVNNDRPVNNDGINDPQPLPPQKRLGLNNDVIARGTLYWDGQTNTAGVAVVSNVAQLKTIAPITNTANYWAQGGISMALRIADRDLNMNRLPQQTINERLGNITGGETGSTQRSAMVYDDLSNNGTGATGVNISLIITRNAVTLGEFRAAIKQALPNADDGIFLDGGGSTQLNSREAQYFGRDNPPRIIPQIVALKA